MKVRRPFSSNPFKRKNISKKLRLIKSINNSNYLKKLPSFNSNSNNKTKSFSRPQTSMQQINLNNVFSKNDVACLCFIAKYKSCPRPYVRTTMYIEKIQDDWKILHVHCSFEPER